MQKINNVSVVIVHYGHGDEVFKCLDSLAEIRKKFKLIETILVDNNEEKTEKSKILSKYKWVKYIHTSKNLGLAGGRNLGFKKAKGEYIFSLDSDVTIDAKSFENLYKEIRINKSRGIVSPRIKSISGSWFGCATLELTPLTGIFYLSFLKKIFPENPIIKNHLMSGWDRKTSRNVETIQNGACFIRKKALEEIGGFDENLFLYFGEEDISKRMRDKGWELYLDSKSEAIHLESKWTPKNTNSIRKIWSRNRFHYFNKNYGMISALIVESFARVSKESILLILILLLGTFLRLYKLEERFQFAGEQGNELLQMKNFIESGQIPLLGPATSHPWLSFGPLYYWLMIPVLTLFDFNPLSVGYLMAIMGTLLIFVNYLIVKSLFDKKTAIISSFLIAVSYSFVQNTLGARFFSLVPFFFYPFIYYLSRTENNNLKAIFWAGFYFGVMINFHYTPLIYLPAIILIVFLNRKFLKKVSFGYTFLGFSVTQIPILIHNFFNEFEMLFKFIAWFPYRFLVFFGLFPGKGESWGSLYESASSAFNFLINSFVVPGNFERVVFLTLLLVVLLLSRKRLKEFCKNTIVKLLILFLTLGVVSLFLHGAPPYHYFLPLYPIPIILFSSLLSKIYSNDGTKYLILTALLVVGIINLKYYFSDKWFYKFTSKIEGEYVPYELQLKAAESIIDDSNSGKYSLSRVGPNDQFEGDFAQNYIYLLWLRGNEPVNGQKLTYTIYEGTKPASGEVIYNYGGLSIVKNEYE